MLLNNIIKQYNLQKTSFLKLLTNQALKRTYGILINIVNIWK